MMDGLPKWLWWFQTPDNPIDGDAGHLARWGDSMEPWPRYVRRVAWLWRNCGYGFNINVIGFHHQDGDVKEVIGDPTVGDNSGVSGVCRWRVYRGGKLVCFQYYRMLKTFLSFLTDSGGWVKGLALVAALIVAAVAGYTFAANKYAAEIARLHADYSATAQTVAKANMGEAEKSAQRLADAVAERDAALRELDARRGDVDGLRKSLASYERRLSEARTGACQPERERLAGCVRLLSEGAGLASEGAGLAERIAIDKDALAKLK